VDVHDGAVGFQGSASKEVIDAARSIARRMRGFIGFADDVVAPPAPPLKIGAPVHARDGRYGTLHKVVVDPHARRVTHLVVRQGFLLTEDRVIPIERVERAEADGIYLDAPASELDQYPRYREEAFVEPLEDWEDLEPYSAADTLFWAGPYVGVAPPFLPTVEHVMAKGVPEDEIVLRRGADIFYNDDLVGSLDHMLFDPESGVMTHLVVQEHGRSRRVIIPAEWVEEFTGEAIVLNRWNPDQVGVPAYEAARDDSEIYTDLRMRLNANPALSAVQVQVDRGAVRLSGDVPTAADKAKADEIARGTPGVIHVDNRVVLSADAELVGRITAALLADPRTANIPIEVIADRGVVTLEGSVPSLQVKIAAEEIAQSVPGVVTVINELEVPHEEPKLRSIAVPLPRTG
jgi:osmotically-inducible protein OsmY